MGTIRSYKATLTGGTGTTIQPRLGRASSFTDDTQDHLRTEATATAHVHNQSGLRYYASGGSLFVNSAPNLGADNSVSTQLLITEGWDE